MNSEDLRNVLMDMNEGYKEMKAELPTTYYKDKERIKYHEDR